MPKSNEITFDPLFSPKSLDYDHASALEIDFNKEIKQLYASQDPIYFFKSSDQEANAALRVFILSAEFTELKTQLDHCFAALIAFVNEQNMRVQTKLARLTGDPTGQTTREVPASILLNRLLKKLKGNYFSDRSVLMYADGKRYLEMLSVLVKQESIELKERVLQLRALIDDDALEHCADGTCSRLQETVENLRNLAISDPYVWMKAFLKTQVTESIKNPISQIDDANIVKRLAQLVQMSEEGFEIHYENWVKKKLREQFGLTFIEEPVDMFTSIIDSKLNEDQKGLFNKYLERIVQAFKVKVTATKMVEFVSHNIYQAAIAEQGFTEKSRVIEEKLDILGKELEFSLGELFTENGDLKAVEAFYKTITFRLLDSKFFQASQLESFETNRYEYKIFKKNLALNLIKDLKEDDGFFSRIVDVIYKPQGLMCLFEDLLPEDRVDFLSKLIQTPEDFIIFLNKNHPDSSVSIVRSLSDIFVALGFSQTSLRAIESEYSLARPSLFERVFSMLKRLNGPIDQLNTPRNIFYESIILPENFKIVLNNYLKLRTEMQDPFMVLESRLVLKHILGINIKYFREFNFPKLGIATAENEVTSAYIIDLDFSGKNFDRAEFHTPIIQCDLSNAEMQIVKIYKPIINSKLDAAQLRDVELHCDIKECSFLKAELRNTKFLKNDFSTNNEVDPFSIENVSFQEATLVNVNIETRIDNCVFEGANILNSHLDWIENSNFKNAIVTDTTFSFVESSDFTEAALTDVKFEHFVPDISNEHNDKVSFYKATLKNVYFKKDAFFLDVKINFIEAKLENIKFNKDNIPYADFKKTVFKNSFFQDLELNQVDFMEAVFDNIEFEGKVTLSHCNLAGSIIKQTALNNVVLDSNNFQGISLEEVTLTPYQLIKDFYQQGVRDFLTIKLVDPSVDNNSLLGEVERDMFPEIIRQFLTPAEIESRVKAFLASQTLPDAQLSFEAVQYLYDKGFVFAGINLEHINFQENNFRDIAGATISFEQAKQLFIQGRESFDSVKILIDQYEVSQIVATFLLIPEVSQIRDKKIQFLTELIAYSVRLDEIQKLFYQSLAFELFAVLTDPEKLYALEKISRFALQHVAEKPALEKLRGAILDSFESSTLKNLFSLGLNRLDGQEKESFEFEAISELLNVLLPYCSKSGSRKKRNADTCASLADELTAEDEVLLATRQKEIDVLVAAERRLFWEKTITPVMSELNRGGDKWFPLLETAKPLSNEYESIEFINVQTQEKQMRELPGRTSLDFLDSLHVLYKDIPPEKLLANVQKLADGLKINTPLPDQVQKNADHFAGDFMLSIGLATKAIIELVNKKGCVMKETSSKAECYFNIATLSSMYIMPALQLGELVGKDFMLADSPLLKGLSVANKALGVVGGLFLVVQDGLDIAKLVNAKNEGERAVYGIQLVIDGSITIQMGISMAAEGVLATASGILLVPLMGIAAGLPTLVNNYEIIIESIIANGKKVNEMYKQQKKGGYEFATRIETNDEKGQKQALILPLAQRYMRPVDSVGIKTIDFRNKMLELEGPWIYSSKSQKMTGCPYVDHDKDYAFDFRRAVGLAKTVALTEEQSANKTWLLPSPSFYVNYQYQQEPFITFRHDAELDTLRLLQRNENFISDKYCFPTSYAIYNLDIEQTQTPIRIFLDKLSRNLIIPSLNRERQGLLTYSLYANDLKEGQTVIYLNPGVSINLYADENYVWVLNGQNLQQDSVTFTEKGVKIGPIEIQSFLKSLESPVKIFIGNFFIGNLFSGQPINRFQKNKRLDYMDKQGHGFILDLVQNKKILTTINYAVLQKQQQTIDAFIKYQAADPQSVFRVVNYSNSQDDYQGIATYVGQRERLFYTSNLPEALKDAVLVYLQKNTAFFYHAAHNRLWCTDTDSNRLLHYYAFPEKIESVHSQGNYLLVNVADRFYYKIDTESKKSLLFAIKDSVLLSSYINMKDPRSVESISAARIFNYPENARDEDYNKNDYPEAYGDDYFDVYDYQEERWQDSIEVLQHNISTILSDATQLDRSYQQRAGEIRLPEINEASVALYVTTDLPPFIWFRKEGENYQLISMQWSRLDEKYIQDKDYIESYVEQGEYLGCFKASHRSEQRVLSYFVKENLNDKKGKIWLQTVAANQGIVSFDNTPERILDFAVKRAVWDNNRLVVLTTENIFKTVDAQGQTQLIGFSADWTQSQADWWQAISVYLENQASSQTLISVQGVKDPQGKDLIVHYDQHAKQFVVMVADAPAIGAVYHGKIGSFYFFIHANCAYQTSSISLDKMADLLSGKQPMPVFEKIADYIPFRPMGIPAEQDLAFMHELPQFFVTLQDFRMVTPYTELAFNPVVQAWNIILVKSQWINQQENPLSSASYLFSEIAKTFQLTSNQRQRPIPLENSRFYLVNSNRFIEIPEARGLNGLFIYLGQVNPLDKNPRYYFYDTVKKELISLVSNSDTLRERVIVNPVKSRMAVKQAAKLDEVSVLLEIDPYQIKGENIPLLENCSQLLLRFTSNTENNFIALPKSLFAHYATIVCQTKQAINITLPYDYSWTASQGKNKLVISNGRARFVIPYFSNRTLPDIILQVKHEKDSLTWVFTDNIRTIAEKLNREQLLKQIPILDYWWSKSKLLAEKTNLMVSDQVGHYRKENFGIDTIAAKLRDQPSGEKGHKVSLLSPLSTTGIAIVSATTTFVLTVTTGLSYVFIRRFRRTNPAAIRNTVEAVSIPLMAQLPVTKAQKTNHVRGEQIHQDLHEDSSLLEIDISQEGISRKVSEAPALPIQDESLQLSKKAYSKKQDWLEEIAYDYCDAYDRKLKKSEKVSSLYKNHKNKRPDASVPLLKPSAKKGQCDQPTLFSKKQDKSCFNNRNQIRPKQHVAKQRDTTCSLASKWKENSPSKLLLTPKQTVVHHKGLSSISTFQRVENKPRSLSNWSQQSHTHEIPSARNANIQIGRRQQGKQWSHECYQYKQYSGSSPRTQTPLSRVTASIDVPSTLFALNVLIRKTTGEKYRPVLSTQRVANKIKAERQVEKIKVLTMR